MICGVQGTCRVVSGLVRAPVLREDEERTLQISETVNAIVRLVRGYVVEDGGGRERVLLSGSLYLGLGASP